MKSEEKSFQLDRSARSFSVGNFSIRELPMLLGAFVFMTLPGLIIGGFWVTPLSQEWQWIFNITLLIITAVVTTHQVVRKRGRNRLLNPKSKPQFPPKDPAEQSSVVKRLRTEHLDEGFTLIEMLVAFAVGALVLVLLTSIVTQSMAVSRKSNNVLLSNNAASTAVDLITRDLASLAVTSKPFEYLQVVNENIGAIRDVAKLLMLSSGGFDVINPGEPGETRAISYRLIKQDPINPGGDRQVYGLYRSVVSAEDTFADFLGQPNLAPAFDGFEPSLDDFLVGNVIDFQIRIFSEGNQTAANEIGSTLRPVRISGNSTEINGTSYLGQPLRWIEVSVMVLQDRDNALSRFEAGNLSLEEARSQYGLRLSRRVPILTPI